MRTSAAFLLLLAAPAFAFGASSPIAAQTAAPAPVPQQARALRCFATAATLVRLIDVATRNLALVANAATQGTGAGTSTEQQYVVLGMLASGTLADQQPAIDLAEQLELCVKDAIGNGAVDAAAAFVARAVAGETQAGIDAADGFASDFERVSPVVNQFLAASGDPALQQAANGAYSQFGRTISGTLHRVRLAVSELVAISTPR